MGTINICFQLSGSTGTADVSRALASRQTGDFGELERQYQGFYKPIAAFLYSNPDLFFSFSFPVRLMEWFEKYHKEFVLLVSEMSGRKQIEFLGGAVHNPVLPALLQVDRVGQIEKFTSVLRRYIGKRPRGMLLPNNAWDPSLVSSLRVCGMEYVIADDALIPRDRRRFLPYIVQEQGKSIFVLGESREFVPDPARPAGEYLAMLAGRARAECPSAESPLVCCALTPEQMCGLIASGWMPSLRQSLEAGCDGYSFALNTPFRYIKSVRHFQRTYIPSGILVPGTGALRNIYDYLLDDSATYLLYSKMMYVSLLLSQSKGDKSRKDMTRELIWQAQDGAAYDGSRGGDGDMSRLGAYSSLIQAERTVREYTDFFESVTAFDYDSDGIQEYICQFGHFNAYVQARGGSVFELDVMRNAHNYAGYTSGRAGLFLDYFSEGSAETRQETFSRQIYREAGFDGKRHEIRLAASGATGDLGQPVTLRKNYLVNSTGIQVQYIIRNDSPFPLKQFFSVRSDFFLSAAGAEAVKAEIISGEQKELAVVSGDALCGASSGEVSLVRLSDNDVTFVFELNENAGVSFHGKNGRLGVVVSWPVDIPSGREIEKTISFSVIPAGRRKKKS